MKITPIEIMLTISILLVLYISTSLWSVSSQAFCGSRENKPHPLKNPSHFFPWVWDATIREKKGVIEIILISRQHACKFRKRYWRKIATDFPNFANQLAYGDEKNILVPVDDQNNDIISGSESRRRDSLERTVKCLYLDSKGGVIAFRTSPRMTALKPSLMLTSIIRCPLPHRRNILEMHHLRLELSSPSHMPRNRIMDNGNESFPNSTESFSVCGLEALQQRLSTLSVKPASHLSNVHQNNITRGFIHNYDMLICAATSRAYRPHLVEWIEHHLLLGVNHFVLYDTRTNESNQPGMDSFPKSHFFEASNAASDTLSNVLVDYIQAGIVSVVQWPYQNCVRGMASGRMVSDFKLPGTISHNAALASCYSRFRDKSRWIAHVDDDEFLVLRDMNESLVQFMDRLSTTHSFLSAAYFRPYFMHDCRCLKSPCFDNNTSLNTCPRAGQWVVSTDGPAFEGKLIMNTKAVGTFFVHYLTMIERQGEGSGGKWNDKPYEVDMVTEGAVLHYKVPAVRSGSIYGATLRYDRKPREKSAGASGDDDQTYVHAIDPVIEDNTLWQSAAVNEQRKTEPLTVCVEFEDISLSRSGTHMSNSHSRKRTEYDYKISTFAFAHSVFMDPGLNKLQKAFNRRRLVYAMQ